MLSSLPPKPLLLFGDQSVEQLSVIRGLVKRSQESPAARRFLHEATNIVQLEFSKLNRKEHGWDHDIMSLLGLAEKNEQPQSNNLIVSTVLMTIGRLGELICHAEQDSTILGSGSQPINIIALCGGLLPAVAAVAARDTSELYTLSQEIISIAFRLAYQIQLRMKLIEEKPSSWGKTYIGISQERVRDILAQFHDSENLPEFRKIVIGVVAKDWLTLVGPPSSLERLESWSSELKQTTHVQAAVTGPTHSRCVPAIDATTVLRDTVLLNHPVDLRNARLISPASCKLYEHCSLGPLLSEMIQDIAHNVLHVTDSIEACVSELNSKYPVKLLVMGPTNHLAAVKTSLKKYDIQYKTQGLEPLPANARALDISESVAVVGMSGRFPGSETVDEFWEDLLAGKCHIKEVPRSRFDIDAFFDSTGEKKNSTTARHGAWLNNPGSFDHRLFNMSPREAEQMDPGHRLLLTVAYEALQSSGYNPEGSLANGSSRIATYFGQVADEWREVLNQKGADIYYVPGFNRAFAPGRLNHHFKWSGGSFSIDTACSTSATTVSLGASALVSRECDMALAGGSSILNSPTTLSGLSRAGMLSTTGGCRTYHEDADGYARGEGVGVVVLKRLEDAISDNDNVLAVIRGSVRTHSPTATSITHPSAASQQATYDQVLQKCALDPAEITYAEMHGTGTQAGDVEEVNSIVNTFAKQRTPDNPLVIGAVKAAIGHGEGAAGVTSLIKMIMMLRDGMIPPQPGWPFQLNSKFPPLREMNVWIPWKTCPLRPSPKGDKKIKMLLNSFDASGGNVSILLEEPPSTSSKISDVRSWYAVTISARIPLSLQHNQARLVEFLERHPDTRIADVAYSTTARRIHEPLRCAYVADSISSLTRQLRSDAKEITGDGIKKVRPNKPHNLVYVFTGQGCQYAGMGATLFRESPVFRDLLIAMQEMAAKADLPYFLDLICNTSLDLSCCSTIQTQLAIVALEVSLAQTMRAWGINPGAVIGHSLGEYAALCVSGVLSVSDMLFLVGKRAELMENMLEANTYGMLATQLDEETLQKQLRALGLPSLAIACVNAPSVTVASGTLQDVAVLQRHLEKGGSSKTKLLPVPYGFHSAQVEPILSGLQHIAKGVPFMTPTIPIISTLTGKVERDGSLFCPSYLARQARDKVNFVEALRSCQAEAICSPNSLWLEFGPDPVCLGLVRQTLGISSSQAVPLLQQKESNWRTVSFALAQTYVSGASVNWPGFHRPFKSSLTLLDLPKYAFDCKEFWTSYEEPAAPITIETKSQSRGVFMANFPTSCLQQVESESVDEDKIKVVFTSRLSEPYLLQAIQGHEVSREKICHLGLFHDMALTAAEYVYRTMHDTPRVPSMSINGLEIHQALPLNESTIDSILAISSSYHRDENMVILDEEHNDAVALVNLADIPGSQNFRYNPYWTDAVMHLAGFVLNSGLKYSEDYACLATGYDEWRSAASLSSAHTYTTYVCLQEVPNSHFISGNCFVFHENQFVQGTFGIRFLKLKKVALTALLRTAGDGSRPQQSNTTLVDWELLSTPDSDQGQLSHHRVNRAIANEVRDAHVITNVMGILAAESGCSVEDMVDDASFSDLGIDSVMAITVLSMIRQQVRLELPASFFVENETIGEAKKALCCLIMATGGEKKSIDTAEEFFDPSPGETSTPNLASDMLQDSSCPGYSCPDSEEASIDGRQGVSSETSREQELYPSEQNECPVPVTTTFSMVGHVVSYYDAKAPYAPTLYFMAGEAGSTIDYINLPTLAPNVGVSGVEPPSINESAGTRVASVQELARIYKATLQTRQPNGPYILGGISVGAVIAFEVAKDLVCDGEHVSGLLLADCAEIATKECNNRADLRFMSPAERAHADRVLKLVAEYQPSPLTPTQLPWTVVQLLAKSDADLSNRVDWEAAVPDLQTQQSDIETGSFLTSPVSNGFAQSCREFINKLTER